MEAKMRDLTLQAAGVLAIVGAIAHGAIAELRVFAKGACRAARNAKTAASSLASQHGRLDRHRRVADCRALARLADRPRMGHCGGRCRLRVRCRWERPGHATAAPWMDRHELCHCA